MKHLCLIFLLTLTTTLSNAKDNVILNYEIVCAGNATVGNYLVKITAIANKKKDVNMEFVKKCAVHGVLYKGFTGIGGCTSQKALLDNSTHAEEYSKVLNSFVYDRYSDFAISLDNSMEVVKSGKKFRVCAIITVAKDKLRKELEKAGVIRKLGL